MIRRSKPISIFFNRWSVKHKTFLLSTNKRKHHQTIMSRRIEFLSSELVEKRKKIDCHSLVQKRRSVHRWMHSEWRRDPCRRSHPRHHHWVGRRRCRGCLCFLSKQFFIVITNISFVLFTSEMFATFFHRRCFQRNITIIAVIPVFRHDGRSRTRTTLNSKICDCDCDSECYEEMMRKTDWCNRVERTNNSFDFDLWRETRWIRIDVSNRWRANQCYLSSKMFVRSLSNSQIPMKAKM